MKLKKRVWLPKWLYDIMPAYFIISSITIGYFSYRTLMLIIALTILTHGLLILYQRWRNRKKNEISHIKSDK